MKIAFIHNEKKLGTGAHYINDLMSVRLKELGVRMKHVYPTQNLLDDVPTHLKGMRNVLYFASLLEHKDEILSCDIIQGTTYTPLAFIPFAIPVISHFGSTTLGFIASTPATNRVEKPLRGIWRELLRAGVIDEANLKTRRPLQDVAAIEEYVAVRADRVIATSAVVRRELIAMGVPKEKIGVIHNAIEDYWFAKGRIPFSRTPKIVHLGRLGGDVFTLTLKGIDRLIHLFRQFPDAQKLVFGISTNTKLKRWMEREIPSTRVALNVQKRALPKLMRGLAGGILLITSRYEGFSLSLIEGMSQGLVPVTFSVGVAPEIIENGKNGFIVRDVREAKRRVQQLLANPRLRKEMAIRARESAGDFRAQKMALQIKKLYTDTLIEVRKKNGK